MPLLAYSTRIEEQLFNSFKIIVSIYIKKHLTYESQETNRLINSNNNFCY